MLEGVVWPIPTLTLRLSNLLSNSTTSWEDQPLREGLRCSSTCTRADAAVFVMTIMLRMFFALAAQHMWLGHWTPLTGVSRRFGNEGLAG